MKKLLALATMTVAFYTYSAAHFNQLVSNQGLESNLSARESIEKDLSATLGKTKNLKRFQVQTASLD